MAGLYQLTLWLCYFAGAILRQRLLFQGLEQGTDLGGVSVAGEGRGLDLLPTQDTQTPVTHDSVCTWDECAKMECLICLFKLHFGAVYAVEKRFSCDK